VQAKKTKVKQLEFYLNTTVFTSKITQE